MQLDRQERFSVGSCHVELLLRTCPEDMEQESFGVCNQQGGVCGQECECKYKFDTYSA